MSGEKWSDEFIRIGGPPGCNARIRVHYNENGTKVWWLVNPGIDLTWELSLEDIQRLTRWLIERVEL